MLAGGWRRVPVLVTGASGQAGHELLPLLADRCRLTAVDLVSAPGLIALDLADDGAVKSLVRDVQPAIIINAAAYTAVDRAETDVDLARTASAQLPPGLQPLLRTVRHHTAEPARLSAG